MEKQSPTQLEVYEQTLLQIVRSLPLPRVSQVVDFARFIQERTLSDDVLDEGETDEEVAADNARWDALLASEGSQRLLEKMADEALAEINAGCARPMIFTEDGDIAPG